MEKCKDQAELDAAIKRGDTEVELIGNGYFSLSVSIKLWARESSQPHIVAWESSQPHIVAWGSSQPHVVARESSQPHIVARESSQPHIEAWAYAQLSIRGPVVVKAAKTVSIIVHGTLAKITGGRVQTVIVKTAAQWCAYYGATVKSGVATIYKGVNEKFDSPKGFNYSPGSKGEAADWDGGKAECGGGLHFSPTPRHTLEFNASANL